MWLIGTALAHTVVVVPDDGTLDALIAAAPTTGVPSDHLILVGPGVHSVGGTWAGRVFSLRGVGDSQIEGTLPTLMTLTDSDVAFEGLTFDCGQSRCVELNGTSTATLNDVHFRDGFSAEGTQLLVRSGSDATVTHSTFTNGYGNYGAHLKVKPGATATVDRSSFRDGGGAQGGSVWNGGSLTMTASQLTSNSSTLDGGAVYSEGFLTLRSTWFEANRSETKGGALSIAGDFDSQDDTFCANSSADRGGALAVAPSRVIIAHLDNVVAVGNLTGLEGGAVHVGSLAGGTVFFDLDGSLVGNASASGAAVTFDGLPADSVEIRDSLIAHHVGIAVDGRHHGGAASIAGSWFHGNGIDTGDNIVVTTSGPWPVPALQPMGCDIRNALTAAVDPGAERVDADGDGILAPLDCDDTNAAIPTMGADDDCDGIDDDCDGQIDEDAPPTTLVYVDRDEDGLGGDASFLVGCPTDDVTLVGGDCNDFLFAEGAAVTVYLDADGDGVGGVELVTCAPPAGAVAVGGDCDDGLDTVYPGADEACDNLDNDCDGLTDEGVQLAFYLDNDGDGYGDVASVVQTCGPGPGYVTLAGDCDDGDSGRNPLAVEIPGNGIDENCDGIDEGCLLLDFLRDDDGDGYGGTQVVEQCAPVPGLVTLGGDCDDTAPQINPDAADTQCNGVDDDCDDLIDDDAPLTPGAMDLDGDGFAGTLVLQQCPEDLANDDCDDEDSAIHPAADEICDTVDNDCDDAIDDEDTLAPGAGTSAPLDLDGDGYTGETTAVVCEPPDALPGDCDDEDPTVNPGAVEVVDNGRDDDCDGVEVVSTDTFDVGISCATAPRTSWWHVFSRR